MSSSAANPASAPGLLSPAVAVFVQSGLSITVASRDERLVPSIAKAVGCVVDADLRVVRMLLFAPAAEAVCRDIAVSGQIAVVFSRPSTNETVQLKGRDAASVAVTPADLVTVRQHLDRFAAEIGPLGWTPGYVDALLWREPPDLVAIRFTPHGAFAQTPGPGAGRALPNPASTFANGPSAGPLPSRPAIPSGDRSTYPAAEGPS